MNNKFKIKGDTSKEFVKTFDGLCGARSRWNIWNDFIHLSAYTISNTIDMVHKEKREKDYMTISSGYTKEEMLGFSELFGIMTMALEEDPNQDFLGSLYMNLNLGNSNTGQFFTPYSVSKACALLSVDLNEVERRHYATAHDPCIGGGAMLIGLANALREKGINYQHKMMFVAQDIDHTCCCMAYIQLSLLGCPGYVVCDDSISKPLTGDPLFAPMDRETFITPMYCSFEWEYRRYYHRILNALGVKPAETYGESDSQSGNIETCSDKGNATESVATHETHEETHACVSEPETKTSTNVSEDINAPIDGMIQLTFF